MLTVTEGNDTKITIFELLTMLERGKPPHIQDSTLPVYGLWWLSPEEFAQAVNLYCED